MTSYRCMAIDIGTTARPVGSARLLNFNDAEIQGFTVGSRERFTGVCVSQICSFPKVKIAVDSSIHVEYAIINTFENGSRTLRKKLFYCLWLLKKIQISIEAYFLIHLPFRATHSWTREPKDKTSRSTSACTFSSAAMHWRVSHSASLFALELLMLYGFRPQSPG